MNIYKLASGKYVNESAIRNAYEIAIGKVEDDMDVLREWLSHSNPIVRTCTEKTVRPETVVRTNRILAIQILREIYGCSLREARDEVNEMLEKIERRKQNA